MNLLPDFLRSERFTRYQSLWLILLSLFLAVLFWGYTVSEEKSLKDLVVPLEFVNVPKNMLVVGDNLARMVTVEFKGSPEMLRRVREEDVDAKVDVSKLTPGPQVLEIGRENVRLPSSVGFVKVFPKILHFTLDKRVRKTVPLDAKFTGHLPKEYQVLKWSISPPNTQIEGPSTTLQRIHSAPTQPVSLDGRSQNFQAPVVPTFSESDISVEDLGPYTLDVTIGERRAQRTIGPVPVKVLNAKGPTTPIPSSLKVMVDGPVSIISRLRPEDFVAEVDVVGLKPSDKAYQLRPAVRLTNKALAGRVDITSFSQRYVAVKVEKKSKEPSVVEVSP